MKLSRARFLLPMIVLSVALSLYAGASEHEPACTADDHVTRSLAFNGDPATLPPIGGFWDTAQPILRFVNLSDTHILDDEASPVITGNYLESLLEPSIGNGSAQRLQEEFTDEVLNAMEKTINFCHAQSPLALMIATGDLTDNSLLNETRRYIDNLDGVAEQVTAFELNCGYALEDANNRGKLGNTAGCPAEAQLPFRVATGRMVADSQAATPDPEDPTYQFTPTRSARQLLETYAASQAGGSHHVAPGLPSGPLGLRCNSGAPDCKNHKLGIPHYAVFGNHDGYPRGTLTFQQAFQAGTTPVGRYFFESPRELINEFFATTAQPGPVGHGFNYAGARLSDTDVLNDGYYAFEAGGARMIVLNTIAQGVRPETSRGGQTNSDTKGLVDGNEVTNPSAVETGTIDQAQFAWLAEELYNNQGKPVLVFSHHPDRSWFDRGSTRNFAAATAGVPAHLLNELLGTYGNVVAHIAGHTHENVITPCRSGIGGCQIGLSSAVGAQPNVANGFWRVETASLIDWPQEGRIVELFDGGNGQYALKLTMIRPDPSDPVANTSRRLSEAEADCKVSFITGGPLSSGPYDQGRLQSTLSNGEAAVRGKFCYEGKDSSDGGPEDRNTILLI